MALLRDRLALSQQAGALIPSFGAESQMLARHAAQTAPKTPAALL